MAPLYQHVIFPQIAKSGHHWPYLLKQQALSGCVARKVAWVKGSVDLVELAKIDRSQSLTIPQLAAHFKVGATTIKLRMRQVRGHWDFSRGKIMSDVTKVVVFAVTLGLALARTGKLPEATRWMVRQAAKAQAGQFSLGKFNRQLQGIRGRYPDWNWLQK
jgi:hypothetical protein